MDSATADGVIAGVPEGPAGVDSIDHQVGIPKLLERNVQYG
ncbi:hypothetical protein AB0K74_34570 [Streptomyces sp. NPDC056159]